MSSGGSSTASLPQQMRSKVLRTRSMKKPLNVDPDPTKTKPRHRVKLLPLRDQTDFWGFPVYHNPE
jgi:hypothetical protein